MTNFTTREEYLAYRADWKARYREASQEIRDLKAQIRAARPASPSHLQSKLHYARVEANNLNIELAEAKEQSALQRNANKLAA